MRRTRGKPALVTLVLLCGGVVSSFGEVDQLGTCLTCHDNIAASVAAAVPHAPAQSGECSVCHNPHVARFAHLLRQRPGPLCGQCHEDVAAELERSVQHGPVAEGLCTACHDPHGGAEQALLLREGTRLCLGCHEELSDAAKLPVRHAPFEAGECATCHEPHASDYPALATAPAAETCQACHAPDATFQAAHGGYPVAGSDCAQCHDPHASVREGLFRTELHAPFESGPCTTCHVGADQSEPFRLTGPVDSLCGECHEEQTMESQRAAFSHVGAGAGGCVACHSPHTSNGSKMLTADVQQVCLNCHDPGGAGSGTPGHFASHGDLACTVCHGPHGAEQPVLLVQDSIQMCGACHAHQHSVTHPMGQDSRDPRNGQPIDCLSCHGVHDAPYPKYLLRGGDRELCVGCHTELAGRGG